MINVLLVVVIALSVNFILMIDVQFAVFIGLLCIFIIWCGYGPIEVVDRILLIKLNSKTKGKKR